LSRKPATCISKAGSLSDYIIRATRTSAAKKGVVNSTSRDLEDDHLALERLEHRAGRRESYDSKQKMLPFKNSVISSERSVIPQTEVFSILATFAQSCGSLGRDHDLDTLGIRRFLHSVAVQAVRAASFCPGDIRKTSYSSCRILFCGDELDDDQDQFLTAETEPGGPTGRLVFRPSRARRSETRKGVRQLIQSKAR
jgi:hypothetical protein